MNLAGIETQRDNDNQYGYTPCNTEVYIIVY